MERITGTVSGSWFVRGYTGWLDINVQMVRIDGRFASGGETIYRGDGGYVLCSRVPVFGNHYFRLVQPSGAVGTFMFSSFLRESQVWATLAANGWNIEKDFSE